MGFERADYAAIARAFGGEGHEVQSRAELRSALEAAQNSAGFSLIAAFIEPNS